MSKGLEDVVASTSAITFIDGKLGRLLYRGYDISELVEHSNYEEDAYLLWKGRLPGRRELDAFSRDLVSKRSVPEGVASIVRSLPKNCDAMDALKVGIAALGIFDDPRYPMQEKAVSIASKIGAVTALVHRHKYEQPEVRPKDDLGYASNFLYTVTGKEPDEFSSKVMNIVFILHADHELNASTFTARVVASTLSDIYSAITAAIGALKGPLHGGANEMVVKMTSEIASPERVESYLHEKLASKSKIMGFGHRVYKTLDPRARILKEYARRMVNTEQDRKEFEILDRLQSLMVKEKSLYPNVDLFSGFVLNHLGIPTYLFTPVFAVGRAPGWLAHVMEQFSDNRIMRPVADYVGQMDAKYVPLDQRADGVPT